MTPVEERAAAYGKIGMVFGLGFVFGPALGGWLGSFDPRWPFWGAAALSLLNAGYGFFVLPESLPPQSRMAFAWRRANPVGRYVTRSHRELFGLAAVAFLGYLPMQSSTHRSCTWAIAMAGYGSRRTDDGRCRRRSDDCPA